MKRLGKPQNRPKFLNLLRLVSSIADPRRLSFLFFPLHHHPNSNSPTPLPELSEISLSWLRPPRRMPYSFPPLVLLALLTSPATSFLLPLPQHRRAQHRKPPQFTLPDLSLPRESPVRGRRAVGLLLEVGPSTGDDDGGDDNADLDGDGNPPVFNWSNFSRPEEYILFTRRRDPLPSEGGSGNDWTIRVDFRKPITWLGLLFFVPIFSSEFFFAISRGFICDLPALPGLCQAVT